MSGLLKRISMMSQFLDHPSDEIPFTLNELLEIDEGAGTRNCLRDRRLDNNRKMEGVNSLELPSKKLTLKAWFHSM
jgi:hypothetical protein